AKAKAPHGSIYTALFGNFLRENGLDQIGQQLRHRLMRCISELDQIEVWRAGLDEAKRNKLNHPDSIWFAWRRDVLGAARTYSRPHRPPVRATGYHRLIHFDQDMIRRAGDAMRQAW